MDDAPRARIAALLESEPGASTQKVARALALDASTADYHLRRLRREGRVQVQRQGREICWFNTHQGLCPVLRQVIPAVKRPETMRVALALEEGPRSAAFLAERSGVPLGQVRWALEILARAGLVTRSERGRVQLAEGAAVCVGKALQGKRCDAWGECAVSRRGGP